MSFISLKKSVSFTVTLAVLSAGFLINSSAQAGLLGGGGAVGGGITGGFTPRSVDIGGNAAGQVQRDPMMLPRGDKAKDMVGNTAAHGTGKAKDVAAHNVDKVNDAKAAAGSDAAAAGETASRQAAKQAARGVSADGSASVSIQH